MTKVKNRSQESYRQQKGYLRRNRHAKHNNIFIIFGIIIFISVTASILLLMFKREQYEYDPVQCTDNNNNCCPIDHMSSRQRFSCKLNEPKNNPQTKPDAKCNKLIIVDDDDGMQELKCEYDRKNLPDNNKTNIENMNIAIYILSSIAGISIISVMILYNY
jgi:hypothetical protein